MSGERQEPSFDRALVTGANGFLGRALVSTLEQGGVDVTRVVRNPASDAENSSAAIVGDVSDGEFVRDVLTRTRPSVVFHLAGKVTGTRDVRAVQPTLRDNLFGAVNVLQSATDLDCERVILLGSGDEPTGDDPAGSPYAASKMCQTVYSRMFATLYGTPVTTARVFMAYGPDQSDESKLVPHTILSLLRGETPQISSGLKRCDWIYIDDVVDALVTLASAPSAVGAVIDVGTGTLHTVKDVVEAITKLVSPSLTAHFGSVADRVLETHNVADVRPALDLAGWSASTDLQTGLANTIEWYRGLYR